MKLTEVSTIKDNTKKCISCEGLVSYKDYLEFIEPVLSARGRIEGQRGRLTTSSAIKIRNRMIADIKAGTVLPPIVLGVIADSESFQKLSASTIDSNLIDPLLSPGNIDNISLIDGMQRTNAIKEACSANDEATGENKQRIELWIVNNMNDLIYRMLVLNTGQVPGNLRRQIEVVYSPILKQLKASLEADGFKLSNIDDNTKRTAAKQYKGDDILELYMVFGARNDSVEKKEKIADEFSRLDFIETLSDTDLFSKFKDVLKYMGQLDEIFSKVPLEDGLVGKISKGVDLFTSQPAKVGFFTAASIFIFGRPGVKKTAELQNKNARTLFENLNKLISKLKPLPVNDLVSFMKLDILNECLITSSSTVAVGRFERALFKSAFTVMITESDTLSSFEPCWRSY